MSKNTCWNFFIKPWLFQQPLETKPLISVASVRNQKFGCNVSFNVSYSLVLWVKIWQIFIPSRLEMLKTHHCALSSTVCNIVGFKMSMKSHCCQKIIRSNIRQSLKNSSKKLSKMTNDFWIGLFFNTFIFICSTLSSTVCITVGSKSLLS